ncbi:MAG: GAF domain-containing protein [Pyrinomonadaceae bacterium]
MPLNQRTKKKGVRDSATVDSLIKASLRLLRSRSEHDVLRHLLTAAREGGFERGRVYLLSADRQALLLKSQTEMPKNFRESVWPLTGSVQRRIISNKIQPSVFRRRTAAAHGFGISAVEKKLREWVWVPLVLDGKIYGGLSLDNGVSRRPVVKQDLTAVALLAAQAVAMLEKEQLKEQSQSLDKILQVSAKVVSSLNLDDVLRATCKSAVELLRVDHSGFVLFSPDSKSGTVYAEFPDMGTKGDEIPLSNIPSGAKFIEDRKPFIVPDVTKEKRLGPARLLLKKLNIKSVLIVPVVSNGRLVGSFGLDSIGARRQFTAGEIEMCQALARQVGIAIENAQQYMEKEREAKLLDSLRRQPLDMDSPMESDKLLRIIVKDATELLKAESGGVYRYDPDRKVLTVIVDHKRPENIGSRLKPGEGLAGRLIESREPFMTVDDYGSWGGRAKVYRNNRSRVGAVLEVPLKWDGLIIGVLYLDDHVGRRFTPDDARRLGLFAEQAAKVLVSAEMLAEDEERFKRQEMLSRATKDIMQDLGTASLDDRLTLIAEHATKILNAEACGVFLVKKEGILSLEASYGHRAGSFRKGLELGIYSGPKSGLTGHIAHEGKLFRAHGRRLMTHPAARGTDSYHTPSEMCYSILAIPLYKKVGGRRELIGLMRIDNKKGDDGLPQPTRYFTKDDGWILSVFAEAVVVAIENAVFVEQLLGRQQDNLLSLIDSSPIGIIANSVDGRITAFNKQAETILGYKREEVMFTHVGRLYHKPDEAKLVGRMLRSRGGNLTNYDTLLRGKDVAKIPIRLSAISLRNAEGRYIGSVGYFDQAIREIEVLLQQASSVAAEAGDLSEGLQELARSLTSKLKHTFCRIFLTSEHIQQAGGVGSDYTLVVEADARAHEQHLSPGLMGSIKVSEWAGLAEIIEKGSPKLIRWSEKISRLALRKLSRGLGFQQHIQSLLVVPLKIEKRVVGLLELGELRREQRSSFLSSDIDFVAVTAARAASLAAQTSILIERSNLYKTTAKLLDRVSKANETAQVLARVTALGDTPVTLNSIARGTRDVLGADVIVLYAYNQDTRCLEYPPSHAGELRAGNPWTSPEVPSDSIAYDLLKKNKPYIVEDVASNSRFGTRRFAREEGVRSVMAIPLKARGRRVGVMFVNYREPHRFTDEDINSVIHYSAQAAVAIYNAQLYEQSRRREAALDALYKAGRAITSIQSTEQMLQEIVRQALRVIGPKGQTNQCFCHVGLIEGNSLRFIATSMDQLTASLKEKLPEIDLNAPPEKIGIAGQAAKSKKILNVGDVKSHKGYIELLPLIPTHSSAAPPWVKSQLSVPFVVTRKAGSATRREVIGVLSIEHPELNAFSAEDEKNIGLLAAQAAIAIQNARRQELTEKSKENLERLLQAARAMAGEFDPAQVLRAIVQTAKRMFDADSTALLSYDHKQRSFIEYETFAAGIANSQLRAYVKVTPRPDKTTRAIMRRGIVIAADAAGEGKPSPQTDRAFLRADGVKSFMGVVLKSGDEPVGVLYVNYRRQFAFAEEDGRRLESFASYAALSLRKARLLNQLKAADIMSAVVANLTASRDIDATLLSVAQGIKATAWCDSVTLYEYDWMTGKLKTPPTCEPKDIQGRVKHPAGVKPDSLVYKILERKSYYKVESVAEDELFKKSVFAREAGIKSCMAIPLRVVDQPVGVIFANFSVPHKFTDDETNSIQRFADQAAVALINAQLYEQERRRVGALTELHEAGRAITGKLGLNEILSEIPRQALRVLGAADGEDGYFSHVALLEGRTLDFRAASSERILRRLRRGSARIEIDSALDRAGIAGEAARWEMVRNIADASSHRHYFALDKDIGSQLSVPLKVAVEEGEEVKWRVNGVLSIERRDPNAFSPEEEKNIELLAAQAAIAIQNAQVRGQVGARTALAWMGMTSSFWRHEIDAYAINIRAALNDLRPRIERVELNATSRQAINRKLNIIESEARKIWAKPIILPLGAKEGVVPFYVNDALKERLEQLWGNEFYQRVTYKVSLAAPTDPVVLCDQDWFNRAFDIVVDNAVESMADVPTPLLTVGVAVSGERVEISITDRGTGIPADIFNRLFKERIDKERTRGFGVGLLMVQAIMQAYGGDIAVKKTSPRGTTVMMWLPVHQSTEQYA